MKRLVILTVMLALGCTKPAPPKQDPHILTGFGVSVNKGNCPEVENTYYDTFRDSDYESEAEFLKAYSDDQDTMDLVKQKKLCETR